MNEAQSPTRSSIRIPADIDRPDRILAGLTARQLAIVAVPAVALWIAYAATRKFLPLPVFAFLATPVAAVSIAVALGRFHGVSADRLLLAALRQARSPKKLIVDPDGSPPSAAPKLWTRANVDDPSSLCLPFTAISEDGVITLANNTAALIARASSVSFSLRTLGEQEALVAGFASYLNSLSSPIQIVVRAEPVNLAEPVAELRGCASMLANPDLASAALSHADFLESLGARRDLYVREVLVVFVQTSGTGDTHLGHLKRRAEEAASALAASGVALDVLDGAKATDCLVRCTDPAESALRPTGLASATETIRAVAR